MSRSQTITWPSGDEPPMRVTPLRCSGVWLDTPTVVSVQGRLLTLELVYVGSGVAPRDDEIEPALIDPALPVDWTEPDHGGPESTAPSYQQLAPQCRAAYLTWLSGGRSSPNASLGFVKLFLYGLERRFLVDLDMDPTHPEASRIAGEMQRLGDSYGYGGLVSYYAYRFLELFTAAPTDAPLVDARWMVETPWDQMPLAFGIGLAWYAGTGMPLAADWALAAARLTAAAVMRTPASRCAGEFNELFRTRYRAACGDGLIIESSEARLTINYQAASPGLGLYERRFDTLPDVTLSAEVLVTLTQLATECTDALAAYSRFLGRHPDACESAEAIARMPEDLAAAAPAETLVLDALRSWVGSVPASGHRIVAFSEVLDRCRANENSPPSDTGMEALPAILAKVGLGIEPDVRFGGHVPERWVRVALFPIDPDAPAVPSTQYAAASQLVYLAAVVAAADGSMSEVERRHVSDLLATTLGLDRHELVHLDAHLVWLVAQGADISRRRRRRFALEESVSADVGQFLVGVAAADGPVTPAEITKLTLLFRLLGLSENDLYSTVHAPALDTPPTSQTAELRLDPARVAQRLADSATVSALLTDLFADDDAPNYTAISGLDAAHSSFSRHLATQPRWARGDAEAAAEACGLPLLDGALDRINEAAMDACGEPLVDGDDPFGLNDYAVQELLA